MASCPQCGEDYGEARFCPTDGVRLEARRESPRAGQIVGGRYRLGALLGEGGVGEIFEAEHLYLERRVALKLLRPQFASDAEAVRRLEREARSASAIGHPNIVDVVDFGLSEDQPYLAMELVRGESLEETIRTGFSGLGIALDVMAQVCDGLAAAHAAGVIHRDLKPANILIAERAPGELQAKVLDFGIAKLATSDANLTRTGSLVGTPYYMAPEQAHGADVDHRADVYAVGVILYQLVTARVPFSGDSFIAILHKHATEEPERPSARASGEALPRELDELILRSMAKEPAERVADMEALAADIREIAAEALGASPPPPARAREGSGARDLPGDAASASSAPVATPQTGARGEGGADGPEVEAGEPFGRGRRRPAFVATMIGIAVLGGAAAIAGAAALAGGFFAGEDDVVAQNGVDPASSAAPSRDVEAAGAEAEEGEEERAWRYAAETGALAYEARVFPFVAEPRSRTDVELEIEPRDGDLTDAVASGDVEARFVFEYYRDHRVVSEVASDVSPEGEARAILSLPDPGKYHVDVSLDREGVDLADLRFDICIGADPRDPEARERVCPRMNP